MKNRQARLATCPIRREGPLAGLSADQGPSNGIRLKHRAVLVLIATPHGYKGAIARALSSELRGRGLKASPGSLYSWRRRYLAFQMDGLKRRRRCDAGRDRMRIGRIERPMNGPGGFPGGGI